MASINELGNVVARCPGCGGAQSTFEWKNGQHAIGNVASDFTHPEWRHCTLSYRLFRCAGCGRGGLGTVVFGGDHNYPGTYRELVKFHPESLGALALPRDTPDGIVREFREGEVCLENGCFRAAAGMFRSVLDKTLRANGYKEKRGTTLEQQIDLAAQDGAITESRRRRAHEEIRVLGNDVLHDEWHPVFAPDVELARHYSQRVLEDFYDDRESVLAIIRAANRVPLEDIPKEPAT